jgi:hypothetical protein
MISARRWSCEEVERLVLRVPELEELDRERQMGSVTLPGVAIRATVLSEIRVPLGNVGLIDLGEGNCTRHFQTWGLRN